jgi:hypothetical protein
MRLVFSRNWNCEAPLWAVVGWRQAGSTTYYAYPLFIVSGAGSKQRRSDRSGSLKVTLISGDALRVPTSLARVVDLTPLPREPRS